MSEGKKKHSHRYASESEYSSNSSCDYMSHDDSTTTSEDEHPKTTSRKRKHHKSHSKKKKKKLDDDQVPLHKDMKRKKKKKRSSSEKSKHKAEHHSKKKKKSKKEKTTTTQSVNQPPMSISKSSPVVFQSSVVAMPMITHHVGVSTTSETAPVNKSRNFAPMTKEEYEKKQSVLRRVVDPETGRSRLVKGDGEIVEEIVSKERHKAINKLATHGDGCSFQAGLRKFN